MTSGVDDHNTVEVDPLVSGNAVRSMYGIERVRSNRDPSSFTLGSLQPGVLRVSRSESDALLIKIPPPSEHEVPFQNCALRQRRHTSPE